jgi:hypothetical protein
MSILSSEIANMTLEEKMEAMELLWDDLRANSSDLSSPEWHAKVIEEREGMAQQGKLKYSEWKEAKKDIHTSIP